MSGPYAYRAVADIIGPNALMSDGDWIESKDQDPDGDVRLIQLADIGDGRYLNKSNRYLTAETAARLKCTPLRSGDLLIARMPDPIGRACVFPGDIRESITVVDVCIVRADPVDVDVRWLMNVINADFTRKEIEKAAGGSTRTRITRGNLERLQVPAPALVEQKKIAAILTVVDDKLDVIARQITATQALKQGLMQTLFTKGAGTQGTDGQWVPHAKQKRTKLGRVPSSWTVVSLGEVTRESRSRNSGVIHDSKLCGVSKEHGLVPMRDRVKGASTDRCRIVRPNAFAYNPMRINIGSIARSLYVDEVMVSPDYVVFEVVQESLLCEYLDHFRRSIIWQNFVGRSGDGGVRIRIYFDDLARLQIPLPPIAEQQRIVEILNAVNQKIDLLQKRQAYYQTLKRGLMQKLLTGEWRVQVDEANT